MQFQSYGNGDRVWISQRYGKPTVVKLLTHDGLSWEEGQDSLTRLEGAEKFFHRIEVACIKVISRVLNG